MAAPRFVFAEALLLLLLIPWTVHVGLGIRSLPKARKLVALTLRVVILACLICALAGMEHVRRSDRLAVFFLLDQSNSVPTALQTAALQSVRETCDLYLGPKDDAGLIVFGRDPSIELAVGPVFGIDRTLSFVSGEQTDLAAAIRLALAAFPQGRMRRIVIYSDGNETMGSAVEEVKLAAAAGVAVDVVPIQIGGAAEALVREVHAPGQASAEEPFQLRVVVQSTGDAEGVLRVYQRLREGRRLLQSAEVTLRAGDNVFLLNQQLTDPGFYEYEATIETDADTVAANNEGRAYTVVQGEPIVLVVASDPQDARPLMGVLEEAGVRADAVYPSELPATLAHVQDYSSVVLVNVPSIDLTVEQLDYMEAMVRDFGIGLVMVGGPDAFGAGGYHDTGVERALPVSMDIRQHKVMPRGALVLSLHTCEFPEGNAWARRISLAALDVLSPQDMMGCIAYDWRLGDSWLFPLQAVGDKHLMRMALNTDQIGDMPSAQPGLRMAYEALRASDAAVKRVLMISDGDPAAPTIGLLNSMRQAGISVSTVCINPHTPTDQQMLRWVAENTGGEYYFVDNPNRLPRIFIKEAATVKRGLLVEEPFTPRAMHASEVAAGAIALGMPALQGYVAATAKDTATVPLVAEEEEDPVLAHWRYGLGKAVAFTSDATSRWARDWLAWPGFNPFWAQTIRWSMRETSPSNFRVETSQRDGRGYVRIDAVDEEGRFVNFLRPEAVVVGPGPDFVRTPVQLTQSGPGIYEGAFPTTDSGVYMVNVSYETEEGARAMAPVGLALGYSREYTYTTTNQALLEELTALGGGRIRAPGEDPFQHDLPRQAVVTPLWPALVALAICLLPIDIFVRRVVFDFGAAWAFALASARRIPGLGRILPAPRPRRARATGRLAVSAGLEATGRVYAQDLDRGAAPASGEARTGDAAPSTTGPTPTEATPAAPPPDAGRTDYTKQLLEAKERAISRRRRPRADDTDNDRGDQP